MNIHKCMNNTGWPKLTFIHNQMLDSAEVVKGCSGDGGLL